MARNMLLQQSCLANIVPSQICKDFLPTLAYLLHPCIIRTRAHVNFFAPGAMKNFLRPALGVKILTPAKLVPAYAKILAPRSDGEGAFRAKLRASDQDADDEQTPSPS